MDALVADRYLDALLAAADRRADDAPADAALDPELRDAARVLRRSLVRVHPSFRFEERLAARLAGLAASQAMRRRRRPILPFPAHRRVDAADLAEVDPLLAAILAGDLDPADEAVMDALTGAPPTPVDRRPLLVGGAITSAAISLVGVAWVAWRASRPSRLPGRGTVGLMGRAARTAHARRAAAVAAAGGPA